jgi:hypothetical protein
MQIVQKANLFVEVDSEDGADEAVGRIVEDCIIESHTLTEDRIIVARTLTEDPSITKILRIRIQAEGEAENLTLRKDSATYAGAMATGAPPVQIKPHQKMNTGRPGLTWLKNNPPNKTGSGLMLPTKMRSLLCLRIPMTLQYMIVVAQYT